MRARLCSSLGRLFAANATHFVKRSMQTGGAADTAPAKKEVTATLAKFLTTNASSHAVDKNATEESGPTPVIFVNKFVAFMKREAREAKQVRGKSVARRPSQHHVEDALSLTDRQQILSRLCQIVEQKEVPLVVASRLMKRQWSASMAAPTFHDSQQFIRISLKAWIVDDLRCDAVNPQDARAILSNCAFLLKGGSVSVVGSLAETALKDVDTITKPDALISLMWSVSVTGTRAPREFWGTALHRLLYLNDNLRGKMAGVLEDDVPESQHANAERKRDHPEVGHVFSGLTTRQIYRLLAVLKREKWNSDAGSLRNLADEALKNVVFEVEAASFTTTAEDVTGPSPLSKSVVTRRIKQVADLDLEELVELLVISGDFGIPFSVSAARVADHILTPAVRYLDSIQLLLVMQIARKTHCNSASLMDALATKIEQRGPQAPYALPLTKSYVRNILREPELFTQVNLTTILPFFLRVCNEHAEKVRGEELCATADLLYGLARRFAPASTIGLHIRSTIDLFCRQMNRLLQLDVIPAGLASRLLECTIVLGMRHDPASYENVSGLLETRNAAVEKEQARLNRRGERAFMARQAADETGSRSSSRWENQSEEDLPQLSKAALTVYKELIYMFERMVVVKATLTPQDFKRFDEAFARTGLYNIFLGACLMQAGHLSGPKEASAKEDASVGTGTATVTSAQTAFPSSLSGWMEKRVLLLVTQKIRHANLSNASSDDDVLHVLGHVHCDADKVHRFIKLILDSPFYVLQNQRDLWAYTHNLALRFGSPEDQQIAASRLKHALF